MGQPPPPPLLRESYLAEARAQHRPSSMSRSDSSNSRRLVYGGLKGKAEEPAYRDDPQGPDLSAFLSQEELDKSVNLARQAIGHESREEKAPQVVKVAEKAPGGTSPRRRPPPFLRCPCGRLLRPSLCALILFLLRRPPPGCPLCPLLPRPLPHSLGPSAGPSEEGARPAGAHAVQSGRSVGERSCSASQRHEPRQAPRRGLLQ